MPPENDDRDRRSLLAVRIRPVVDPEDTNDRLFCVDGVDHAVRTASATKSPLQFTAHFLAAAPRRGGQISVDELDDSVNDPRPYALHVMDSSR
jgi:hypothetical protein